MLLLILLCLSVPPNPPATVARFGTVELADLDRQAVERMTHETAAFHVVLMSAPDNWGTWRCYEMQMKPGLYGTDWFEPGPDEDVTADEPDEMVIRGRLRIIFPGTVELCSNRIDRHPILADVE